MTQVLTAHPVATLFPDLPEKAFGSLLEDIRKHGVKVPILVHHGQIIDGRQRYKACQILKRECPAVKWNGTDPWLEAQSRNLMRRHLAQDQIYAIWKLAVERFPELAAPLLEVKRAAKQRQMRKALAQSPLSLLRSQDRNKESADLVGAQLGISGTTVKRVDRLARQAPELVQKVAAGELSVKKALALLGSSTLDAPAGDAADGPFEIDTQTRRLRNSIETSWARCPSAHRKEFLLALRDIIRELIAQHTSEDGLRPAKVSRAS